MTGGETMKVKRNKKYKGLIDSKVLKDYLFIDCDFSEVMFVGCTIKHCFFVNCNGLIKKEGYSFCNSSLTNCFVDLNYRRNKK